MSYADRVKETTTTTGTGALTLAGAAVGFRTFAAGFAVGATMPYAVSDALGNWEIGVGTLTGSSTLARTTVFASSNGNALVNFPAGSKDVFCTLTADSLARGMVDKDDAGFDIVLCSGQSNMVGVDTVSTAIDCADSRVYQFGCYATDTATYQQIVAGVDPLKNSDNNAKVGPATSFAKAYASTIPTNRRVLLVPVCIYGTSMVGGTPRWNPGSPGGDLYESAISQSNAAIAKALLMYPASRFVGVLWLQGETDGDNNVTQAAYATAFKAVIAGFRSRITGASKAFTVIASMLPEAITGHASYTPIDLAHKQVAAETSKCIFVQGPSGYSLDGMHYNAAGARILGTRMGLAAYAASMYFVADTTAPTAASANVAGGAATTVAITMSEELDPAFVPAASTFTVSGHTVSAVSISGITLNLTVSTFVGGESARTAAYTPNGTNNLRDLAGNLLAAFTGLAISNSLPVVNNAPRLSNFVRQTESGTGPYTYAGQAGSSYGVNEGDGYIKLNPGDGELVALVLTNPSANNELLMGIDASSATMKYDALDLCALVHSNYYDVIKNGSFGANSGFPGAAGDYMKVKRVGSTITIEVSKDNEATYTVIGSLTNASTGVMYFHCMPTGTNQYRLIRSFNTA